MSKLQPGVLASLALFGPTTMTRHCAIRSQQRSIPRVVIDLLIGFGEEQAAGGGCYRYCFTKRAWVAVSQHLGARAKDYERYRNAYVVVGEDGAVVTVAWLH